MGNEIMRSDERWIAGVCGGLARRFGITPNQMRLIFVISCLFPGPQFVIYLVLWVLMPDERKAGYAGR
jgi:phage shock protein PspC (stress-responsive transcriptional regulator)